MDYTQAVVDGSRTIAQWVTDYAPPGRLWWSAEEHDGIVWATAHVGERTEIVFVVNRERAVADVESIAIDGRRAGTVLEGTLLLRRLRARSAM